jgi:hypothetical protein
MTYPHAYRDSIDVMIKAFRDGVLPKDRLAHAENMGEFRDRFASWIAKGEEARRVVNKRKQSSREIAEVMWKDIFR